jgi:hypothetical protein
MPAPPVSRSMVRLQDTNNFLGNPADGNRYAYAGDNPANYIDPTGQLWNDPLTWGMSGTNACNTVGLLLGIDTTILFTLIGIAMTGPGALGVILVAGLGASVLITGLTTVCDAEFM